MADNVVYNEFGKFKENEMTKKDTVVVVTEEAPSFPFRVFGESAAMWIAACGPFFTLFRYLGVYGAYPKTIVRKKKEK